MDILLTKKEAYLMVGLNGGLKGSAGQKEEKEFNLRCNAEKVGKGPAMRYRMNEIYDTPKNVVHGNFGRAPSNKGTVRTNSIKFALAKALSQIGEKDIYLPKTKYLTHLGLITDNLKNIEKYLGNQKYHELNTVDKLVFTEVQNMQLALNRFWNEAIELLRNDKVEGVTLHEKLYLAHHDTKHDEATDIVKNPKDLQLLFDMAKEEAKEVVKQQYGKNLFFAIRMNLENKEYIKIRDSKEKYKLLSAHKVDYFYNKYAVEGEYKGEGNFKAEFFQNFVSHRKEQAIENLGKHLKMVTGDFLNDVIQMKIIDRLFVLMFENDTYKEFKDKYAGMIKDAKQAYDDEINKIVDDGMLDFLPMK